MKVDMAKKKILFCASTVSHIKNFHLPYLKAFRDMGYEVHVAANESMPIPWADRVFKLSFYKSLLAPQNVFAIFKSRKLLKEEKYEKVSSNTTLAGLIVRISALFLKNRPRIYHIVHGYHFNLNSGIRKYLYLIPEKVASYVSDVVMVMNKEDYKIAQKYKLYRKNLYYIDGIGIDISRFRPVSRELKSKMKSRMGIEPDEFVFAYAAEFSKRKNQALLIRAFADCFFKKGRLLLAGDGKQLDSCKRLAAQLGQAEQIKFLGYVKDVPELYSACDAVVSVSRIEGLPFNIVEAMGCTLPVIASNIKGHQELVDPEITGILFEDGNKMQLCNCMKALYFAQTVQLECYGKAGAKKAERFLIGNVLPKVIKIYQSWGV